MVFIIVPIPGVNLSLVRDRERGELQRCAWRFAPLVPSVLVGTVAGLVVLASLPQRPLKLGLGVA